MPVAVYCWVRPFCTEPAAGAMVIDCSVGPVTVRAAGAEVIAPAAARILAVPPLTPVATPLLLTVATPVASEPNTRVFAARGAVVPSV